ncbi:peptidoglycan editing factor PgeF [Thiosocius teredinicola]|uniref:peptidoglycan editing factor PgeF n=1 Tax=Thiosocius teredinicola TaxID=1973002 RepID=UPI000990DECD
MKDSKIDLIRPDWPAPANVGAVSTTRAGGVSSGAWSTLNLGTHVGDVPTDVEENRHRLTRAANLPSEPQWLQQVHGTRVRLNRSGDVCADAGITDVPGVVSVVMTADCLPVLFCDVRGTQVAAAHAGWRGLQAGILEQTVRAFNQPADQLMAWMGPAIGPAAFEVGDEVHAAFTDIEHDDGRHFSPHGQGHWLADLYGLARARLHRAGVGRVFGGSYCTYSEAERFFSYRRDGVTGRMASLIWLRS